MMKFPILIAALSLAIGHAHAETVGLRVADMAMPHHDRPTRSAIWYPAYTADTADGESAETLFADSPVFHGVTGREEAGVAPGTHPVVLLSHGMGGGIESVAWLARDLAARGAVVVSVDHLGSTWQAFDMATGIRHWTRAQDLRRALDVVLADAALSGHLDETRIMAAGFSFGGWTALSLGGARANLAGLLSVCADGADLIYCKGFGEDAVMLADQDAHAWNADHGDARIDHVVAIDPGFVWGIEAADLSDMVASVTLIGLGEGPDRLPDADFDAGGFADLLPSARVERMVPATHFTAMPLCKPAGATILREEKDDPVCTDPAGADRVAVHRHIADLLAAPLGL